MRTTWACVTTTLLLAAAGHGYAQVQPPAPAPAAPAPPQAGTPQEPAPDPATAGRSGRSGRTPRTGRTSSRRPSSRSPGLFYGNRRSRDTGPLQQHLILTSNLMGGYDDNVGASLGSGTGTVPGLATSGSTGYADLGLDYFRGTSARSFRAWSQGNVRMYPDYLDQPAAGGLASAEWRTRLGDKDTFRVGEQFRYEPLFRAGLIGADGLTPPATDGAAPAAGLFERRSWLSSTSVSLDRDWTRSDATHLSYTYLIQRFTDDTQGDNQYHEARAEYRRAAGRRLALRGSYRYRDGRYTDYAFVERPRTEQTVEGGPEYRKTMRRQRQVAVLLGAGATYVETVSSTTGAPYDAWVPYGSATVALDLPPAWWLGGGYRRGFSVLQGLTAEVYSTDTAYVTTRRLLTSRIDVGVGGTFATGRTLVASGVDDEYDVYGAWAQLRVALTSTMAATAGYFYYEHRYSNPDVLPTGFPARYDRNAFRVGLTFWVPLVGTASGPPAIPGIAR